MQVQLKPGDIEWDRDVERFKARVEMLFMGESGDVMRLPGLIPRLPNPNAPDFDDAVRTAFKAFALTWKKPPLLPPQDTEMTDVESDSEASGRLPGQPAGPAPQLLASGGEPAPAPPPEAPAQEAPAQEAPAPAAQPPGGGDLAALVAQLPALSPLDEAAASQALNGLEELERQGATPQDLLDAGPLAHLSP